MSNVSPGRLAGIIVSLLLLVLIAVGGFGGLPSTDASWSDQTTVTGTYRGAPVDEPTDSVEDPGDQGADPIEPIEGHITNLQCTSGKNTGDEKPIILTWDVPAAWQDQDIVYDVAWQDNLLTSYSRDVTVYVPTFGPFFPTDFPGTGNNQHADLTFTIQAKLADGEWQSDPITIDAHGPTHGGVLHCGTSNRR